MRDFNEVQQAAKERAARAFQQDIAKRNEGIKNISAAPKKEQVQEVKEQIKVAGTFKASDFASHFRAISEIKSWIEASIKSARVQSQQKV